MLFAPLRFLDLAAFFAVTVFLSRLLLIQINQPQDSLLIIQRLDVRMQSQMQENEQTPQQQLSSLPKAPMSPLQKAAEAVSNWSAGSVGTGSAVLVVVAWVVFGSTSPNGWDFGDRFITAVSFLLLFLLQRSQKKDTQAIQLKLNELLAAFHRASPKLINIEDESEEEVERLHQQFQEVQAKGAGSHSIDEAEKNCLK